MRACAALNRDLADIFVRILRGSSHLSANTYQHWAAWMQAFFILIFSAPKSALTVELSCSGSVLIATVAAYLIADGIPVFNGYV